LAKLVPLDLKIQEIANLYRLKKGEQIDTLNGKMMQKPIDFRILPHPVNRPKIILSFEEDFNKIKRHKTEIYTDGSKIDNKTSAAFLVYGNQLKWEKISQQYRLDDNCSVFQAELIAIEKALIWTCGQHKKEQIGICSDSLSALKAIKSVSFNPKIFSNRKIGVSLGLHRFQKMVPLLYF
jgi:hypothetical protein